MMPVRSKGGVNQNLQIQPAPLWLSKGNKLRAKVSVLRLGFLIWHPVWMPEVSKVGLV